MNQTIKLLFSFCCVALLCSCANINKLKHEKKTTSTKVENTETKDVATAVEATEIFKQKESSSNVTGTTETGNDFSVEFGENDSSVNNQDPVVIERTDNGYILKPAGRKIKSLAIKEKSIAENKHAVDVSEITKQNSIKADSGSLYENKQIQVSDTEEESIKEVEKRRIATGVIILAIVLIGGGYIMYQYDQKLKAAKRFINEDN